MKTLLFVVVLFCGTLPGLAREKQVAFGPNGQVRVIDRVLAGKIGYFAEYSDFQQAMLFQVNDSSYVLEILTGTHNESYRTRKTLTASETRLMLEDISARLHLKSPKSLLNQEGRTQFLLINSLVSYSYYGMAASLILTEDMSPAVYLLSAGTGFIVPILFSRNLNMSLPQSLLTGYGQTRGILHGMLLPLLVSRDPDFRVSLAMGMAGSFAEAFLGYRWARKSGMNDGQASTISVFGDFGMVLSTSAAFSMGLFENMNDYIPNALAATTLAGAAGGLLVGNALSKKDYYSQGDAGMTANLFLLGSYLPLSLMASVKVDNPRWYTAAGTIGAVAGIWGGDKLAQKFDFSNRQSMFASLSMIGGGFLGAGIGHLIEQTRNTDEYHDYDPTLIALMSALGAATGLGLSVMNYTKDINKENKDLSLKINFNPLGFVNAQLNSGDPTGKNAIPVVMGRITF